MGQSSSLPSTTTVVAADDCLSTTIDGETVILDTQRGKYYGFNDVGTEVWDFLQQPHTVEEVVQQLMSSYDVTYDRCRSDVESLLAELLEKQLVKTVE